MRFKKILLLLTCVILGGMGTTTATLADENDQVKLTFLGTGAPRPSHDRYGPAILLEAGKHKILVDAGPGLRERLFQAGGFELVTDIHQVLITHLHYDHTIGLPNLWLTGWLFGRKTNMEVYGPMGTTKLMTHFEDAYDWDLRYRYLTNVHKEGSDLISYDVTPGVIFDEDDLKITAFKVEHMPINIETGELLGLEGATLGYRIDYKNRSVLFSGDTRSTPDSDIIKFGKGVDVLIHETQVPSPGTSKEALLANVSMSVHSTPAQVAYVFNKTRPRLGIYSHIIPPETTKEQLISMTDYDGEMNVAEDLMTITIGDKITFGRAENIGNTIFTNSDVVDE